MIFAAAPATPLARTQLSWLAALVLCAQFPLWIHVPLWVAAAGAGLVVARLALPTPRLAPPWLHRWLLPLLAVVAAVGIRAQFGYFLARDPCVVFLYLLLGVKYVETRSPRDGGLLVCLAVFLLLTQFFYAQTIGAALLALPGVLALGGALAALREAPASFEWKAPFATTARMLVQGIPLAALLFILFPRLAGPLWGTPADAGARTGLSERMAPGSIGSLSISDEVAFRVDFAGPPPPPVQRYWRGPVLSRFDGEEWTLLPRMRRGELAGSGGRSIDYTVTLEPHGKLWLFALEHPTSLPRRPDEASGGGPPGSRAAIAVLTYDQLLLASAPVSQTLRYQQRSALGDSFPAVGDSERRENLQLPRNNPRTAAYARELRGGVESDRAFIAAVLARFHNEAFVYTLTPTLLGVDPVDEFLFDSRRGFCEHYAGAFVVLLRAAGIPARVVTGYQGGEINPNGEYMIVRQSDAHAWAEALLDGAWQRFDPTAAVAPSRIEHGLAAALPQGEPVPYLARLDMTWLKSLRLHWDAINYQWQRGVVGFNVERQRDLLRDLGLDIGRPWELVVLAAVALSAWGAALLGFARLRTMHADPAVALWSRACRRLARAGLRRRPDEGPLEYTERAALRWPQCSAMLRRIGETYALLRYGPESKDRAGLVVALRAGVASLPAVRALRMRS